MIRVTSTMIIVDVTVHAVEAGWLRIINNETEAKKEEIYTSS